MRSVRTNKTLKGYWVRSWLVYSAMYPVARLFMAKKKVIMLCEKMIKSPPPQIKEGIDLKDKEDWDMFIEIFLRDVYRQDILKSNMTVVDIGAHIGIYSVLAAKKAERIISVEPAVQNYERLKVNTANLKNVITKNIALSDKEGQMPFYLSEFSHSHSLYADILKDSANVISETKISVSTLDSLLKEMRIDKVDVIKIDAEGEEFNILKGAQETLRKNPKAIIIVASYHYPDEKKKVVQFLSERGFHVKTDKADIIITGE